LKSEFEPVSGIESSDGNGELSAVFSVVGENADGYVREEDRRVVE
jgi:hypothetical protein